jgi:hypothetical protein
MGEMCELVIVKTEASKLIVNECGCDDRERQEGRTSFISRKCTHYRATMLNFSGAVGAQIGKSYVHNVSDSGKTVVELLITKMVPTTL